MSGDVKGDDMCFANNDENTFHDVTGNETDSTAILDGFIITAGNANFDVWPDDGGGGMNNHDGSPTIINCIFKGNSAFADGGGMRTWGDSQPTIVNCTFIGNKASQEGGGMMNGPGSKPTITNCLFRGNSTGEDGGGMYNNESDPLIVNCLFVENSVKLTGGGMYNVNGSTSVVTNCTFVKNSASSGGGMCNTNSNPTLVNCLFWNNSAEQNPELFNPGSKPIVTHTLVAGGYGGTGNIDGDPLFADPDMRLSPGSPCIDAGDNSSVPKAVTTDLDGNPRIINNVVDMGVFEYDE